MEYVTAGPEHIDGIHHVMQSTIRTVYPKYYPTEVVDFFCRLHSREHVQEGVESGNRDVLLDEGKIVGRGTHRELLETCPTYREIAESQLSKEELA